MQVDIRCVCPQLVDGGVRHAGGDQVTLRDTLDFRSAASIRSSLAFATSDDEHARSLELLGILTESYLLFGVTAWSVVDDKGKPLAVSHAAIRERLLSAVDAASVVADAADELYNPVVLFPLLNRASSSSPPTSTDDSTSAQTGSSRSHPKRSRRSSMPSTRTGDTATTTPLRDGGYSSLPSAPSAAPSGNAG